MQGKTVRSAKKGPGDFPQPLIVRQPTPGVVRLLGADGIDLLHRISTNSLLDLEPGHVRPTILTNALGRIIDVITVLHGQQGLMLVTSPDRGQTVQDWIQSYIFFQDDVVLKNETGTWAEVGVYLEGAAEAFSEITESPALPERDGLTAPGETLAWVGSEPLNGYRILLPADQLEARQDPWVQSPGPARSAYHALRIAAGVPASDHELTQDVTPLDVDLDDWVSFGKGCYIGQEVIARMESRQQRRWRLLRLTLTGKAAEGSPLLAEGRNAGTLASVAHHPQLGWIGLGLLHARDDRAADSWQVDGVQASRWPADAGTS